MRGERSGYGPESSGGLADKTGEGGQVGPNVGEEDEGLTTGLPIDRQAFEPQCLKVALRLPEALRARW
jgi:hypothetical protein